MHFDILILLLVSVCAANLPFFTTRIVGVIRVKRKSFLHYCVELVLLYFSVGCLSYFLEQQHGPVHRQNWQFYVTTFTLFTVLAFPGFVMRYLWRRTSRVPHE